MAESVTVDHGGVSITTNTASEADLRAELEAPAAPDSPSNVHERVPTADAAAPGPVRDDKGRFVKAETAATPSEAAAPPEPAPLTDRAGTPARTRDDTLPRNNPIARLNKVMAEKAEIERRAAQLEAELGRYRQPSVTQPVTPAAPLAPTNGHAEPQFDQFADQADPYTAYLQAWTRWDHGQQLQQARAEWDAAQAYKTKADSFQSRLAEGRSRLPDFDDVLTQADTLGLQVSAVMQEAIADSPHAADLVHYLATHPEECTQLAEESVQTPVAAATVMRRLLEAQLLGHVASPAAPAKTGSGSAARASVSTAKPPVMPVGSSPVVSDEPPGDSASAAEHARYWNRRLKVPGTK